MVCLLVVDLQTTACNRCLKYTCTCWTTSHQDHPECQRLGGRRGSCVDGTSDGSTQTPFNCASAADATTAGVCNSITAPLSAVSHSSNCSCWLQEKKSSLLLAETSLKCLSGFFDLFRNSLGAGQRVVPLGAARMTALCKAQCLLSFVMGVIILHSESTQGESEISTTTKNSISRKLLNNSYRNVWNFFAVFEGKF